MLCLSRNSLRVKIIIFFIIFLLPVASAAANINQADRKRIPVTEKIDLLTDGSINPVRKNITIGFDFITELHFELDYEQINWIPSDFGSGDPLENGTVIFVNDEPFFETNITTNDFFFFICDEVGFIQDDKEPKVTHIYGVINFFQMAFPNGLAYVDNSNLYFVIQDDLTHVDYSLVVFEVLIKGFQWDETKTIQGDLTNPFDTMNIWFVWVLSMWPLWLVTIIILAVFIFILRELL